MWSRTAIFICQSMTMDGRISIMISPFAPSTLFSLWQDSDSCLLDIFSFHLSWSLKFHSASCHSGFFLFLLLTYPNSQASSWFITSSHSDCFLRSLLFWSLDFNFLALFSLHLHCLCSWTSWIFITWSKSSSNRLWNEIRSARFFALCWTLKPVMTPSWIFILRTPTSACSSLDKEKPKLK